MTRNALFAFAFTLTVLAVVGQGTGPGGMVHQVFALLALGAWLLLLAHTAFNPASKGDSHGDFDP